MIPAIVLAAGRSSRMGQLKALMPIGADTLLSRIVSTLREGGVDDVVVVTGHEAERIRDDLDARGVSVRLVVNADYDAGQLSSLLAGLAVVDRPGVIAALVTLVDVPLVAASTVRAVCRRYRETRAPIVRPMYRGRFGHPMLLDRALFDELRRADPAQGAKPIVRRHATPEGSVEVDDPGATYDVDTPEDYAALLRLIGD